MENGTPNLDFDRLTHAYILSGGGARPLAARVAAAIVCSTDSGRPCGTCRHCRKAFSGIHPDIISISPQDGKAGILVNQIRELIADAYIIPSEADRKVYIVDPADKMNVQAQNALLKIIEEPPAAVTFLFVTDNPNILLDTIRSRCVEVVDSSDNTEIESSDEAKEFFSLLVGTNKSALAEAIAGIDKREKASRERLQSISSGVQALAMSKLKNVIGNNSKVSEEYMHIISVFRRLDNYMAANMAAGNLAGVLLYEFVPLTER